MTDGSWAMAGTSGTVERPVCTADGTTTLTLRKVLYVAGVKVNLSSVHAIMTTGHRVCSSLRDCYI